MEAFTGINRKIESLWGWRNSFPFFNLDCFIYGKLLYYKQDAKKGVKLMDTHDIVLGFSRQVKDILFSIVQKVPEPLIPAFVMNWVESYIDKRTRKLKEEIIRQKWQQAYLEKVVEEIHGKQGKKEAP